MVSGKYHQDNKVASWISREHDIYEAMPYIGMVEFLKYWATVWELEGSHQADNIF